MFFALGFCCVLLGIALRLGFKVNLLPWVPWALGIGIVVLRWRQGPQWRWLSFAIGSGSAVVVAVVGLVALVIGYHWWMLTDFDAAAWRQAHTTDGQTRLRMVDDLLDRDLLVGRTVGDVDQLLGVDDSWDGTGYASERLGSDPVGDWERVWALGGRRFRFEWLLLDVDERGIVRDAGIKTY